MKLCSNKNSEILQENTVHQIGKTNSEFRFNDFLSDQIFLTEKAKIMILWLDLVMSKNYRLINIHFRKNI